MNLMAHAIESRAGDYWYQQAARVFWTQAYDHGRWRYKRQVVAALVVAAHRTADRTEGQR